MTMPHLMNCPHKGGTWCLKCVGEEWDRREAVEAAKNAEIARLTAEVERLRAKCERLRVLWDLTEDEVIRRSANNDTWTAAEFAEHDRQYARARAECHAHNDLKEPTDG